MENIEFDVADKAKVSSLKLVLLILSMPLAVFSVGLLSRIAPNLYHWIPNKTKGLVTETLILYLVMYFLFVYVMIIKNQKYKLANLGLNKTKLIKGIIFTLILYVVLQVYSALESYLTFGKFSVNKAMADWVLVAGYYLELIFGVGLFEEVVFRGFLISQMFMRLKSKKSKTAKMFLALIISQFLFSIVHIPIRIANGVNYISILISLGTIFVIGMVFAILYVLTENLFICIGVHAIWDAAMNNVITIYNSSYAFVIVGLFVFVTMYVKVINLKNKKRVC